MTEVSPLLFHGWFWNRDHGSEERPQHGEGRGGDRAPGDRWAAEMLGVRAAERDVVSDRVLVPSSRLLRTESQPLLPEEPPPRLHPVGAGRRCGRVLGWTLLPELGGGLRGALALTLLFTASVGPLDPFSVVGTRIWATLLILVTCCASEHLLAFLLGSENAGFVHLNYNLAVIIRLY